MYVCVCVCVYIREKESRVHKEYIDERIRLVTK